MPMSPIEPAAEFVEVVLKMCLGKPVGRTVHKRLAVADEQMDVGQNHMSFLSVSRQRCGHAESRASQATGTPRVRQSD